MASSRLRYPMIGRSELKVQQGPPYMDLKQAPKV
jgi:hypothetical protein